MNLQVHVREVEGHHFILWHSDDVNALSVVSVVIGPVWRYYDSFNFRVDAAATRVS